jgi:hypothetical protein
MSSSFKPLAFLKCLATGHAFQNSHSHPGYLTCVRCKFRKRG